MFKTLLVSAGRAAALSGLILLVGSSPASAVSTASDAGITVKVKLAIATAEGVRARSVNVDTVERRVTLHGTVDADSEREAAEQAARTVDNVREVRNLLQVVAPRNQAAVAHSDEQLAECVSAALEAEPSLRESTIEVQSVNNGVVLLKGNARNLGDHLTAVLLVNEIDGVRRIGSEVRSQDVLVDADLWKERNIAVGGSTPRSTRSAADDLYTTSMVKLRLLADPTTPALDINVDTRRGVVTLFGIVPSESIRSAAVSAAATAAGVTSVKNNLLVVPGPMQAAASASDDVLATAVRENLSMHPELPHVNAEVSDCVVRLTGTISSAIERVEAMQVARATKGVCRVEDELTVQ
jgi:hyperosmotically inducible protein